MSARVCVCVFFALMETVDSAAPCSGAPAAPGDHQPAPGDGMMGLVFAIFAVGNETQPVFLVRICDQRNPRVRDQRRRWLHEGLSIVLFVFFGGQMVLVLLLTV